MTGWLGGWPRIPWASVAGVFAALLLVLGLVGAWRYEAGRRADAEAALAGARAEADQLGAALVLAGETERRIVAERDRLRVRLEEIEADYQSAIGAVATLRAEAGRLVEAGDLAGLWRLAYPEGP